MSKKLKAAVFDVDGMLLDTREFIFQAYEHTLAKHGLPAREREVIAQQVGRSLADCYAALAPNGDITLLSATHHEFQGERLHLIESYPGLNEMLEELHKAGLKMGVFSSRKGNLVPSLNNAGIVDYFDVVVQGDEVINAKPHPEGLLKVLDHLGVQPDEAVMLGDAAVDIEAGKAAKVAMTVGITHGFGTRDELEKAKPDHIVSSLAEIPSLLLGS